MRSLRPTFLSRLHRLALADALALQLAAGGHDVAAPGRAHGARVAGIEDDVAEGGDGGIAAALEGRPGPGVEGDQVDLGRYPFDQLHQRLRIGGRIVDAFQHHIFEGDAPGVAEARICAAGLHQLGDGVFLVDRHDLVAQLVGHRMERDGEIDAELGAGTLDHRHHAGGRERDLALGDRDPLAVHDDAQRLGDVVVIVERLAHSHHDDVGDEASVRGRGPFPQRVAGQHDLAQDLRGP